MPSNTLALGLRTNLYSSVFNPTKLFDGSTAGFSLSFDTTTSLYQDSAGTTPLTLPDQTVGMALGMERGLTLGPELVANGDFAAGATGWTATGAWAIASGNATATATSTSLYGGGVTAVSSRFYKVEFDVISYTSGTLAITVGGNYVSNASLTGAAMAAGRKTVFVSSGATTAKGVEFYGGSISTVIDNISVREIKSVPAVQASLGLRPTWGRAPKVKRNLATDTAGSSGWTAAGTTPPVVTNGVTFAGSPCMSVLFTSASPTGYAACRAARSIQVTPWMNGVTYAQSIDVALSRALVGAEALQVQLYSTIGLLGSFTISAANSAALAAGAFGRVSMTGAGGGTGSIWPVITPSVAMASDVTVYTKDIQIEVAPVTAYQAVTTATDMTEAGYPSYGYIRPDLSDDVLTVTTPAAQTGDVLVFGRNGSWIESNVTYGSGAAVSIGINTVTGLPAGLLTAIGDIVGIVAIGRTLTAAERTQALEYHKARGAAGWLVAGAEAEPNGAFASGTGWTVLAGWAISGGAANATATSASLTSTTTLTAGQLYLVTFDWTHTSGTLAVRAGVGAQATFTTSGAKRVILQTTSVSGVEFYGGAVTGTLDNVSVKPLTVAA